jgi:hypothetical protein
MSVFFISGHTNLTQSEFDLHYKALIDQSINHNGHYVIGNAKGADTMALEYLLSRGVDPSKITIYFYDRFGHTSIQKYSTRGLHVVSDFGSYTARDAQMTYDSTVDILWVRPEEESKKLLGKAYKKGHISGTEKNLLRRQKLMNT